MAISYVGTSTIVDVSAADVTPGWPTSYTPTATHYAVIIAFSTNNNANNQPFATPAGWAQLAIIDDVVGFDGFAGGLQAFGRVLTGGDTLPLLDSTNAGDPQASAATMVWSGVDTTTPMDATPVTSQNSSAAWTPTGITTVTNGADVVSAHFNPRWNHSPVAAGHNINGFTLVYSETTRAATALARIVKATAGAQTMPTWASDSDNCGHIALALRPAAGGGAAATETVRFHLRPPGGIAPAGIRSPWFGSAGDGATSTDLTVADSLHAHAADNVTLTQVHVLTVADGAHAHSADNVTLTQSHVLIVTDAVHGHVADSVTLTQVHVLTVADSVHAHTADNIVLTQSHTLVVADSLHTHTADNVVLSAAGTLVVADAVHAHTADNVTLTQTHVLTVADGLHAHSTDQVTLTQVHQLVVADSLHAHAADNVVLAPTPTGAPSISRLWQVRADDRTLAPIHDRTIRLPANTSRTLTADYDRTVTTPTDHRTIGATP